MSNYSTESIGSQISQEASPISSLGGLFILLGKWLGLKLSEAEKSYFKSLAVKGTLSNLMT